MEVVEGREEANGGGGGGGEKEGKEYRNIGIGTNKMKI